MVRLSGLMIILEIELAGWLIIRMKAHDNVKAQEFVKHLEDHAGYASLFQGDVDPDLQPEGQSPIGDSQLQRASTSTSGTSLGGTHGQSECLESGTSSGGETPDESDPGQRPSGSVGNPLQVGAEVASVGIQAGYPASGKGGKTSSEAGSAKHPIRAEAASVGVQAGDSVSSDVGRKTSSEAGSSQRPSRESPLQPGAEAASVGVQAESPEHSDVGKPLLEASCRTQLIRNIADDLKARAKAAVPRVPDDYPSHNLGYYTDPSYGLNMSMSKGDLRWHLHTRTLRLERWHRINAEMPGLQLLRKEAPFMFLLPDVLSRKECEAIMRVAKHYQHPSTHAKHDPGRRTSTECRLHWDDCPNLLQRLGRIINVPESHLEPPKIIRYKTGQYFQQHTDAHMTCSDQPTERYTEANGNRTVVIMIYLNDVAHGGSTIFSSVGFRIRPKQGLAVIHFPSDVQGRTDGATQHAGEKALSEKWVMTVFGSECALKRDWYEANLPMPRLQTEVL